MFALGCEDAPPPAPDPVQPVKILEIAGGGTGATLEFPGEIRAAQQVELAFENSGKLLELPVLDGQEVARGEVLARLDPRDFENIRDAENAKLARAEADYSRVKTLFEADVASQQELDRARSQFDVARANADRAIKNLEDDAVIVAPFAGTVARVLAENFQNVQAKQTIVLLQDTSTLEVAFGIPESAIAGNRRRATEQEQNERLQPRVTVSSVEGREFPATVKEFSPTADPTSRTYEAVVAFENPSDVTILPGMTASVRVNSPTADTGDGGSIQIPARAALADEQGKAYVWKVDPSSMQVSRSAVELGALSGESVTVTSGLASGDWIAVSGVHKLREGMRVRRYQG
jgi:RND family efflux transporter MFP subunit